MKRLIILMLGVSHIQSEGFLCSEDELVRELREDLADNRNLIIQKS